jgi:hypothetical protein
LLASAAKVAAAEPVDACCAVRSVELWSHLTVHYLRDCRDAAAAAAAPAVLALVFQQMLLHGDVGFCLFYARLMP